MHVSKKQQIIKWVQEKAKHLKSLSFHQDKKTESWYLKSSQLQRVKSGQNISSNHKQEEEQLCSDSRLSAKPEEEKRKC